MKRSSHVLATLMLFSIAFSSAAHAKKYYEEESTKYYDIKQETRTENVDPWESFNRPMFDFNIWTDRNLLKPFLVAYDVIPLAGRTRIGNFLTNLGEPLNTIHGVLQLDPEVTFTSMWRFILNTTFGLGGIHDVAGQYANLPNNEQDLGLTLGSWGVGAGPYLVLPIMGPTNARGGVGMLGNWALDPIVYMIKPWEAFAQRVAEGVDFRDKNAAVIESLYYDSLDPYTAVRSSYLQNQAFKSRNAHKE